jgi:hypothetical protein
MKKLAVLAAVVLGVVVAVTSASASAPKNNLKNYQHVWVVMMENTSDHSLIGNVNAPYTNQLANTVGYAKNYYGVTHPSQPNYVAITSGATTGFPDDNDHTASVTNIVDQLESHGKTWRDYQQSLSLCNGDKFAHACGNQLYERKHNPFVSYTDVASSPSRMANVVDLDQLHADLWSGDAPDYNFIAPDQCHDMHGRAATAADPCDFSNEQTIIQLGDTFLQELIGEITSSPAWNGNSAIFVVWDESDFTGSPTDFGFGDTSGCCDANPGGGHVLGLVLSHSDHTARTSDVPYNHYSALATIEDGWNLGRLGHAANVTPMSDLVGPKG